MVPFRGWISYHENKNHENYVAPCMLLMTPPSLDQHYGENYPLIYPLVRACVFSSILLTYHSLLC